jgi:Fe2+ transport system protein FeoA
VDRTLKTIADPRAIAGRSVPVDQLGLGLCGTVRRVLAGVEEGDRLKALGICEGRKVMLVRSGDPLILRVLGAHIGLSARLAEHVEVEPCSSEQCECRHR